MEIFAPHRDATIDAVLDLLDEEGSDVLVEPLSYPLLVDRFAQHFQTWVRGQP
jgi:hypothetical protein